MSSTGAATQSLQPAHALPQQLAPHANYALIVLLCHLFLPPPGEGLSSSLMVVARDMGPQCASMIVLYTLIGLLNRRSKRLGDTAARQVGGGEDGMQGVASIPSQLWGIHHGSSGVDI